MSQSRNKAKHGGPNPIEVSIETVDNVTAKTNCLNGVDKHPDRLLLHMILRVDGIDDLYMLQECSRNEPALEDTLARIMVL